MALYEHYTLNVYSVLYTVVPVYIVEIAPTKLRGRLISFNSVGLTAGLLVRIITFFFACNQCKSFSRDLQINVKLHCWQKNRNACNYNILFCSSQVGLVVNLICERFLFGWRISLSVQVLVGFIIAFGMLFLPETPRCVQVK